MAKENGVSKETDELKKQLAVLQKDLAALTDMFAGIAETSAEDLKAKLSSHMQDVRAQSEHLVASAQDKADFWLNEAENQVRKNPAVALGIASGIGFIAGLLLARR